MSEILIEDLRAPVFFTMPEALKRPVYNHKSRAGELLHA
jgi:hypothetical protein